MAEILVIPAKIPTLVRIPECRLMGSTPFCYLQKASRFMWLTCFVSLCDIIQYICSYLVCLKAQILQK